MATKRSTTKQAKPKARLKPKAKAVPAKGKAKAKPKAPPAKPKAKASKPKAPKPKGKATKRRPRRKLGRPRMIDQMVTVELPAKGKKRRRQATKKQMTVGQAVVTVLACGCSIDTAASVVGITRTTIYDWIAKGQEFADAELKEIPKDQRVYTEFSDAVARAREMVVQLALDGIIEAGKEDWRALAWFLERSRPDEFGRRTRYDFGDGKGGSLTLAELMASSVTDPSSADDSEDPDL